MSTSKARFQQSGSNPTSKGITTKGSATGSGSKRANTQAGQTASGFVAPNKSTNIQVIYNGKILTPQSLIPRKHALPNTELSRRSKAKKPGNSLTIEEGQESPEKASVLSPSKPHSKKTESDHRGIGQSKFGMSTFKQKAVVEETVSLVLSETETHILLSLPSLVVATDTREVMSTDERNTRYENLVKSHTNADLFSSRPTQTKNLPKKTQSEMAAPNALREFGTQATAFDITDDTRELDATQTDGEAAALAVGVETLGVEESDGLTPSVRNFIGDTVGLALVTPGCLLDTTTVSNPSQGHRKARHGHKGASSRVSGTGSNAQHSFTLDEGGVGHSSSRVLENHSGNHHQTGMSTASSGNGSGNLSGPMDALTGVSGSRANLEGGHSQSGDGVSSSRNRNENSEPGIAMDENQTFTEADSQELLRAAEIQQILSNPVLLKRLHMIERAIQQNANHRPQLDYRDLPDIEPLTLLSAERVKKVDTADQLFGGNTLGGKTGLAKAMKANTSTDLSNKHNDNVSEVPSTHAKSNHSGHGHASTGQGTGTLNDHTLEDLEDERVKKLFSYSNEELTQGRAVTAMVWNAVSSDLLAVGYGRTDVFVRTEKVGEGVDEAFHGGLVLFWSLRNPDYPEKILRTAHPVTALSFSKQVPMILAVGLMNGDVNVYDVRREGVNWSIPMETSAGMTGAHSDPVWQLKWIVKGVERLETLVSISTDGRVLEWSLKKGLVVSTLMQLKKSGTGEGWISNSAAGLCFDFHPTDSSTYVTGTEDGSLYRCSVSYNEQYLETYVGHSGPVNKVKFSPRWPALYLTCSADWSLNLYHLNCKTPLLNMKATGEQFPINDICWCPDNSTVFGCVTGDAKVQIWDLNVSSIDPVVTIDTNAEDLGGADVAPEEHQDNSHPNTGLLNTADITAPMLGLGTRFNENKGENKEEDPSPVHRLIKHLSTGPKKKTLTTVLFGERNPTVVVGDNRGTVTVYRVFEPQTITHLGPLQQTEKLKEAVMALTDPATAAIVQSADSSEEEKV